MALSQVQTQKPGPGDSTSPTAGYILHQASQGRRRRLAGYRGRAGCQGASPLLSQRMGREKEGTFARSCPEFRECGARFQAVSVVTLGQECIWSRKPAQPGMQCLSTGLCVGPNHTDTHTHTHTHTDTHTHGHTHTHTPGTLSSRPLPPPHVDMPEPSRWLRSAAVGGRMLPSHLPFTVLTVAGACWS